MYDTAFRYIGASTLSIACGKLHEQLYNYIRKEETLPYCIHCRSHGLRTLSCSIRSKPPQSYRSPMDDYSPSPPLHKKRRRRKHLTRLPPPLSHHLPSTCSPQPSAVTSTVAAAATPTVNSCTSARIQTVVNPNLVPSALKELHHSSFMPPPPSLPINSAYLAVA